MALNISRLQALCGTLAVGLAFSGAVYLGSSVAHAGQPRTATAATAAQELPPLSYVCTMPGDEDVIDDKPGTCPKCGMKLVPVRLDAKWWCPVHQSLEVHDGPGKCRRDGRDLVQVTVSETWTCSDEPDAKHLEPGKCGDGTPRKIKYEVRAHGDHNPRHGGQFFMASDAWHHIEGTYPQAGLFRVFFYDNFTKPLAAKTFGGTVVVRDASDKEIARAQLAPGPVDNTLEARIPAAQAGLPLRVTASIRFSATGKEQGFDFQFNEYSKDPGTPSASLRQPAVERAAMVRSVEPRPAARPASAVQSVRAVPAAYVVSGPPVRQARLRPAAFAAPPVAAQQPAGGTPAPAPPGQPPDLLAGEIAPMPPALAAALDESVLPKDVPGLLTELRKRVSEVDSLVKAGSLSEVWLPAMGTKTVALVLGDKASELPAPKKAAVTSAVSRVVTAAWLIDGYGDLGNRGKIVEAYDQLTGAITDLEGAYGNSQ